MKKEDKKNTVSEDNENHESIEEADSYSGELEEDELELDEIDFLDEVK